MRVRPEYAVSVLGGIPDRAEPRCCGARARPPGSGS
jgi:hypothetical protein